MARVCVFFFNDTATTEIYTLSLHDALPISTLLWVVETQREPRIATDGFVSSGPTPASWSAAAARSRRTHPGRRARDARRRSEEHTSELQSRQYLVCRLLLEKKTYQQSNLMR